MAETTKRAANLLVECLAEQGTDRIFTVPGESFLAVLDALHGGTQIDTVTCRQEGGAAFMACADGALTGRPGVAFVTRGPGATNASIGVHVAHQDSQPMVLFVGDVARPMQGREGFQEVDFPAFFAPISKWAARIDDPSRIPEYVARAFSVAISGRPGPAVLALPEDMLCEDVSARHSPRPRVERPTQAACPDAMQALLALLADAASPVAIVGGAGWNRKARHHFQAFAERIGLPVATAFRRQDAIPASSPVYAGSLGYGPNPKLVERVRNADLILAVGARLGEATTEGYSVPTPDHPGQVLIHVHPDPEELGRVYRTDLALCCAMDEFAEAAALWEDGAIIPFDAGAAANREWREWATHEPNDKAPALDLAACVTLMRESLPHETILANGAGNFAGWFHRYWRYEGYPAQLAPTCGAMGYGVPAGIAAALRHPERPVVAVAGDGDFLMNGQELASAAQAGANLLVVVVDNGAYGTIRMHQEREYPGRVSATELANPDFAALAEAFGAWAARAETTEEFAAAFAESGKREGVRLIHAVTEIEQLAASGATVSSLRNR
ncbi:acetolactate synthase-1/2/3 large subunit [Erythrobacter litoralis]|jgi:acetolactate synthase-1/2/3 large subunit|uniref:Thiamine pyrophosphate-binding protein n=1 Tax=Erythrobacter litoralis TaxID=39960 RepID=A0A074N138_9SPHN|nr:thiamine pyrophosphate-dependent enzyme [Erythrobacter litoralis]AOL23885.1 acetolactate synthase-1/2/3 large subunit [Erythrobacter litoralis]KEO98630.1 thiamine pyrophosphate-binding protein [Erythrobacter litoralis]MEE4337373.1 thiamine pyrophosphate-dependent enzyme [Erythrobacter sp.]